MGKNGVLEVKGLDEQGVRNLHKYHQAVRRGDKIGYEMLMRNQNINGGKELLKWIETGLNYMRYKNVVEYFNLSLDDKYVIGLYNDDEIIIESLEVIRRIDTNDNLTRRYCKVSLLYQDLTQRKHESQRSKYHVFDIDFGTYTNATHFINDLRNKEIIA